MDSSQNKVEEQELDPTTVMWIRNKTRGFDVSQAHGYEECAPQVHPKEPMVGEDQKDPVLEEGENDLDEVTKWLKAVEGPRDPIDAEVLPLICSIRQVKAIETLVFQADQARSKSQVSSLEGLLKGYDDLFDTVCYNEDNTMVCDFKLKEECKGTCVTARGYPMSEDDTQAIQKQVEELTKKGFIEEVPGTEYPQVICPAFLVPKPDGTKRFVVDYSKLNALCAPCALPLPLMDGMLERLARCAYKSKMDLQHGFWQVKLTPQAKLLTAFILPNQAIYRFKVLPMGLSASPGVFQMYTNRHIRRFKQSEEVRQLVAQGSVVEVLMDDFLFGSPSLKEHLKLLELWFKYSKDNKLFFKKSKCEFCCQEMKVLGRQVGVGTWGPIKDKLDKVITKRPSNQRELRGLLGAVNWIRRHVMDITATYKLSELLRKNKKWKWQEDHEEAFQRLKKAVEGATDVHIPVANRPMVLFTDASEDGGGGLLLQAQVDPKTKQDRMVFLGHWGWKWTGARQRYPMFEKELLSGVLLIASQAEVIRQASTLHWMCDAAAVVDFLQASPPSQKRRQRWWFFLKRFPIVPKYVQGVKNEFADYLSRKDFEHQYQCDLNSQAKEEFQAMDDELDLALVPLVSNQDFKWTLQDVIEDFPQAQKLVDSDAIIEQGNLWSKVEEKVYIETRMVVPKKALPKLVEYFHVHHGHPSAARLQKFLQERFQVPSLEELKSKVQETSSRCQVCLRSKPNRPQDRGITGCLPVPFEVNAEVAVDIVYLPSSRSQKQEKVLFMMDTLSKFTQACYIEVGTQEEVSKIFWREWIARYGAPARLTADNDIRWSASSGTWSELLKFHGIEAHFTTPYRSEANGRCERHVQEFNKILRAVKQEQPSLDTIDLLPLAITLLNAQPHIASGMSSFEMFHINKCPWYEGSKPPQASTELFASKYLKAFEATRNAIVNERNRRQEKNQAKQATSQVLVGSYVLVHCKRFPSYPKTKIDSQWLGPYLVTQKDGREVRIQVGQGQLRVDLSLVKLWTCDQDPNQVQEDQEWLPMSEEEMRQEGYYVAEKILAHKRNQKTWLFEVQWRGFEERTWEPLKNFIIPRKKDGTLRVQDTLQEYLEENNLNEILEEALKLKTQAKAPSQAAARATSSSSSSTNLPSA